MRFHIQQSIRVFLDMNLEIMHVYVVLCILRFLLLLFFFFFLHFANQARVYFRILHPQSKIVNKLFLSVNKEIKTCNDEYLPVLLAGRDIFRS